MLTMRCISAKLSMFSPLMATTRSPGWKPAVCAALLGCTVSTRALVICLPKIMKTTAKMAIARMKFAIGPAATTAARGPTGLWMKLTAFSLVGHAGGGLMIGHARRILVAEEFHIAAERDRGDFPARAVAVVEADDFGPETDRKRQHFDAAPASHQKMAKLMKKHDNCQDKQEGNQVADETAAERAQATHNSVETHHTLIPAPYGVLIVTGSLLG